MSRHGYSTDWNDYYDAYKIPYELHELAVLNAIGGKRGQKALKDLAIALDGMEAKRLIADNFESKCGEFCTLGVLANFREIYSADYEERVTALIDDAASLLNIAPLLAKEIMFLNDDFDCDLFEHDSFINVKVIKPLYVVGASYSFNIAKQAHEQEIDVDVARWYFIRYWVENNIIKDNKGAS